MKTVTVALMVSALVGAPVGAKTLTIGLDVSASNPLLSSEAYARSAAVYVRDKVAALQPGDVVALHTLGDRSLANFPAERIQISRRERADKVGARIAQFIASMPSKNFEGQASTNILGFFAFGQFDCANGGDVLLLTDGIESSPDMNAERLLAGKSLPRPEKNGLSGCTVTMFGVGQSRSGEWSPLQIKHIRTAWTAWMGVAGARYTAIIDP